jgi:hypothetical protein
MNKHVDVFETGQAYTYLPGDAAIAEAVLADPGQAAVLALERFKSMIFPGQPEAEVFARIREMKVVPVEGEPLFRATVSGTISLAL